MPPGTYMALQVDGKGVQWGGGEGGCILQLNWVKWSTFTFPRVPFLSGIHIVRLMVGKKHSTLLSILFDSPTD